MKCGRNAAARLLNRKRMELECVIEALEAVGYEVQQMCKKNLSFQ